MVEVKKDQIAVRTSMEEDKNHLIEWFKEPGVLQWFPMCNEREVEDAVRLWMSGAKEKNVLTVTYKDVPCAMANLYVQTFEKIRHQALFGIIVREDMRGKGVGTFLIEEIISLAKRRSIEILHLEVYDGNPAERLYKRMGFSRYGYEKKFIKENGKYSGKVLMQKIL